MKRLFRRLILSLRTNGRDWTVFALSLLLAFSIWFIHNLSLNYSDFLRVKVSAVGNIPGHSAVSANTCEVSARCRTNGFNFIKFELFENKTVEVNFKASDIQKASSDLFFVTAPVLNEYAYEIFGDKVNIEYFLSDTLFFRFPTVASKKVPVLPVHSISLEPQYMTVGDLTVLPDSVIVSGESHHIENIDRVHTEPIKIEDLKSNKSGVIPLEKLRGIRFSEESVHYHVDVSRYVEIRYNVSISPENVPSGKEMMIYPSHAEAVLRCAFPLISNLSTILDIGFFVDYDDFIASLSGKCMAEPRNLPDGVIDYELIPGVFKCVLNDK